MGKNFRTIKSKIAIAGTAIVLLWSCGKSYDRVDTIKGPKGDKGDKGDTGLPGSQGPAGEPGKDGSNGKDGANGKDSTGTNLPPLNPYPPIIIIQPGQQCTPRICPSSMIIVCACIDATWKTISISPNDVAKIRIRNYGRCEDWVNPNDPTDCIFWPRPQPPIPEPTVTITVVPPAPAPAPTVTVTVMPYPVPTVTVTAYPVPVPTITITPRPNQC